MAARLRPFDRTRDFEAVTDFLVGLYRPDNADGNWFGPIWEYAYTHAWFDDASADRIGIWEDGGRLVAVASYELRPEEAFLNASGEYAHLRPEMLAHAERHFPGSDGDGRPYLNVFVNHTDKAFEEFVRARGYVRKPEADRPMSKLPIPSPFPPIALPSGFRLQSLADDNDLRKVDRVLHRGFNHPGEPPDDGGAGRRRMQSGPHFRRDLTIVAVAPDGEFVSFAGTWLDVRNRFAYVEPVATDPNYRRRGLGRAAVLEGIRRCGLEGATVAYVATTKPFYLSFGFRRLFTTECWTKQLDAAAQAGVGR